MLFLSRKGERKAPDRSEFLKAYIWKRESGRSTGRKMVRERFLL